MPEIKWQRPEAIQSGFVTHVLVPSFGRNGSSKDFIVYSCFPEELLIVLVIHRFPHARMETACSVQNMGIELILECVAQR